MSLSPQRLQEIQEEEKARDAVRAEAEKKRNQKSVKALLLVGFAAIAFWVLIRLMTER